MGELIAGTPALRLSTAVSLPLDLISVLSLLYRAVPGSDLDPWLIETRRALPDDLRADLDLLHGFSGRLLYYVEEPVMRFAPLRPDRLDASFDDLRAFLRSLPPEAYRAMAAHALARVHDDLGLPFVAPSGGDLPAWRAALEPALTTASMEDALALIGDPPAMKRRTTALFERIWDEVYRDDYERHLPLRVEAAEAGRAIARGDVAAAFGELTGHRAPPAVLGRLPNVQTVTFCPSVHLGRFVSFIVYPPDLVVYFDPVGFLARARPDGRPAPRRGGDGPLGPEELLEVARALADPTRLRILDLLAAGELYAQEIVGRLGIAQSAVSRHLAQLERASLVVVQTRRGLKYYAVNPERFAALGSAFSARAAQARR